MARVLLMTPEVRAEIKAAIERARAEPVPLALAMAMAHMDDSPELLLKDRKPGAPDRPPSQCLLLSDHFEVAFSFEEQPAGMVRHMSVALQNAMRGKVPNAGIVAGLAREFGFSAFPPVPYGRVWLEEYKPGRFAVNVAELVNPPTKKATRQ